MKKLIIALAIGLALSVAPKLCLAAGVTVSVTASAGGTAVVPQGNAHILWITLNGSNAMYCRLGGVPTSTSFDIYLNGLGATWNAPVSNQGTPSQMTQSRVPADAITCLSSTGTQAVSYYKSN